MAPIAEGEQLNLKVALDRLVLSGLVFRTGASVDAIYAFKHALVQDAAYSSLLRRRRQELHRKIAQTLETDHPGSPPEVLAHHFEEGSEHRWAAAYLYQAGQRAQRRSAFPEAIAHYARAIALIQELPDADDHAEFEIDCIIALGPAIIFQRRQRSQSRPLLSTRR